MLKSEAGKVFVGVGGWTFPPWRGVFYPKTLAQKRELEYLGTRLNSCEINGTFYSLQKPESFAKWRDETPDRFVFALKGSRYIVNRRELAGAGEAMPRFFGSGMSELGSKLGPILWQFAHTKRFDPDDIARFLDLLPREVDGLPLRHALEPRHDSFKDKRFTTMVQERGHAVVFAEHDTYPQIEAHAPDFAYVRVQQTREAVDTGYEAAELDRITAMAKGWAAGGRDVFLFVISGAKVRNPAAAEAIIARLG
jgi:uncharacterized protein YecE (DUF72 family)